MERNCLVFIFAVHLTELSLTSKRFLSKNKVHRVQGKQAAVAKEAGETNCGE